MGISVEQYRQRIGCFTISGSFKDIRYERILKESRLKGFRTVIRFICVVALVSAVLASSLFIVDLTQFGDVEKNPGPNPDQQYKFHRIGPDEFEIIVAYILENKYGRPFLVYKGGRDGGIDAEASNIGMLTNDKIIVQVKHTSDELKTLKDGKRISIFEQEKSKVEKLVDENKLETYVIVTNYQLPAGQAQKLKECFEEAGAKNVEVYGYETLCTWVSGSRDLKEKLFDNYPVVNPIENRPSPSKRLKSEPEITDEQDAGEPVAGDQQEAGDIVYDDVHPNPRIFKIRKIIFKITCTTINVIEPIVEGVLTAATGTLALYSILDIPAQATLLAAAILKTGYGINKKKAEIKNIIEGCLQCEVHCFTEDIFLEIVSDYKTGTIKERLEKEYLGAGIKTTGLEVKIKNMEEVERIKTAIEERRSYSTPAKAESEVKTTKNQDLPVTDENQLSTEKEPDPVINPASVVSTTINNQSTFLTSSEIGPSPPKRAKCEQGLKDQKYKFHLLAPDDFEDLAAIVLEDKYKRPFHVYKGGQDGGIDLAAWNNGDSTNETIIVQVKHTSNESGTLTDSKRKSVFEKEKPKVQKLVKDGKLDTYIIFTNYPLPAGQAQQLEKCFKDAGAKNVEVVGYETLCNLLTGSLPLKATLLASYPVINPASIVSVAVQKYDQCTFLTSNEDGPSPPSRLKSEPDIEGIRS